MNKNIEFAGTFYPDNAENLNAQINSFKDDIKNAYSSKAVIVPHAGYIYSGHCAMNAFKHLTPSENIFIIAPSHKYIFDNISLPKYTYFDTPLGSIEVNNRLIKEINENFPSVISDDFFVNEHSIEVELPFLQNLFLPQCQNAVDFIKNINKFGNKFKIVPILTGKCDYRLIADIIEKYWENSSFVISSDLSHFYSQNECRQIDSYTAAIIESGKIDCFEPPQACGLVGIKGLVEYANRQNYSLIRAEIYNSGDVSNDKDKVVGYGSWFLYENARNDYIKSFYSDYVIELVKNSISSVYSDQAYVPENIPQVFSQYVASFVTLKIDGQLRGCIGSIYPTKPLLLDIMDNAKNAAFYDPRFNPLTQDEFKQIDISVSLLSDIERIIFKDEKDLLSKIYPNGLIISEREKRAVYLPVVWEQLPDREIFLNSLKEKAGLPPNYFSKTIEAYKFSAIEIS